MLKQRRKQSSLLKSAIDGACPHTERVAVRQQKKPHQEVTPAAAPANVIVPPQRIGNCSEREESPAI